MTSDRRRRSSTIQLFHGSEVAFWPFAETHAAGVLQAVPNQPGTEIILESTANGVGNFFHKKWREAETGRSEYLAIFVPWHWQDEYRLPAGKAFKLSAWRSTKTFFSSQAQNSELRAARCH